MLDIFSPLQVLITKNTIIQILGQAVEEKKNASPEVVLDSSDSEKMVQMNIWNGKLPNESLIKLHAVLMVMRAFHNEFDDNKAIQKALEL